MSYLKRLVTIFHKRVKYLINFVVNIVRNDEEKEGDKCMAQ